MKLLVLGLDGATFDVIDRLGSDHLPCLQAITAAGVSGPLESTFPPVTGPAWTAFATGKNPGKTGVFGFRSRTAKNSFDVKMVTSTKIRQAGAWWDYLSNNGIKVGIWNYPVLCPPYPINGFMVGGFGCSPDRDFTYPTELKDKLLSICGTYKIAIPLSKAPYADNPSAFVEEAMELLHQNERAIDYLLTKDTDVFVGVLSATDFVQHYMWRFIDSSHPLYDPRMAEIYGPSFVEIWQRVDSLIENVIGKVGAHTNIMVASDHGFGPHYQSFYINSWLESKGYLTRSKSGAILTNTTLRSIASKVITRLTSVNPRLSKALKEKGVRRTASLLSQIDMQKTIAFANAHATNSGQIYLNMTLQEGSKTKIRQQIAHELRSYCCTLGLKVNIYFPEQIYSGKFLDLAPDLLFDINDFECSVHFRLSNSIYRELPHQAGHSGSHRRNGILIARGPDIEQGRKLQGAKIYDIAPTILHMFGLPVPDDMDGRTLQDIFREGSQPAGREVQYRHVDGERERVKDRIRELRGSTRL